MRHFVLEGEYLVPFDEIAPLIPQHRAFLQRGYDAGVFLCSGPQVPARGGFLLARADSREQLMELLADEPFTKARKMRFVRIAEFNPVQHQPMLKEWFTAPAGRSGPSAADRDLLP